MYLSNGSFNDRRRIALFISGSGSTVQALMDQAETLNIVSVMSSKKSAGGLARAKRSGVSAHVFNFQSETDQVLQLLNRTQINTIFLAGFMKILSAEFIHQFKTSGLGRRIFNIHPSLLPDYKGLAATESAFADKARLGVTIHDVVSEVDSGKWFKRTPSLSGTQTGKVDWAEAALWQRAGEQNILKAWGSCHQ